MDTTNVRDDQLPRDAGTAAEVEAFPAASVLVLRDGPVEVLMIRRNGNSSFVPNAWVFPGGGAEEIDAALANEYGDGSLQTTMRLTAVRETFEETGVWLGDALEDPEPKRRRLLAGSMTFRDLLHESPPQLEPLVWTSRWVTPVGMPKRFDTFFFLARVSRDVVATPEEQEAVEVLWISPEEAVERHKAGELQMVFPTWKNLEAISGFATVDELLDSRRMLPDIPTTLPRLVIENGQKKIVV